MIILEFNNKAANQAHGHAHKPTAEKAACPGACLAQRTGNSLSVDTDPHYRRPGRKGMRTTKSFVQLGHDVAAIINCAYPSFGFGRRNSVGISAKHQLLVINLASVPGRQLVNSPTAQNLGRWRSL